jgi:hypothetical protein
LLEVGTPLSIQEKEEEKVILLFHQQFKNAIE